MEEHSATTQAQPALKVDPDINYFGMTNYRNQFRKFGIKLDDRRRHMYVVGKTGMGKTTLLENMVLNDIYAGHGVGYIDPHGDTAEKILNYIPAHRINDVVYFNPADIDYPIGFNILETINPEHRHLVASGLMGVFKKIWPDVWSARMEYILNNTILALLDFPGTTLLGINRMLADEAYRKRVVNNLKDPVVKAFWQSEFANYTEKFRTEAVAPIQNKIGQFLSASVIRNIVAQVKSRIDIRDIMDAQKIFIINLSKGRIGEDNSRLLGGMLVTRIQLAAMERVDILESERKDFFLYVDEFQNFATESFANILSEARKYRLDLIMAHQYMEQLDEKVLAAVIGNVGTTVTFRVGSSDAEILAKEFIPTFVEEDLINLPKFHVYLKLMIDGVASRPFSAITLAPIAISTGSTEKVVRVSRERYAVSREKIEDKIMRWSGMAPAGSLAEGDDFDEGEEIFVDPPAKAESAPPPARLVPATPAPRPPPTPAPRPMPTAPRPAVGGSVGSFSTLARWGEGVKKKRKRKRHQDRQLNPASGERVLLVDPSQRGISLTQAMRNPSPPPPQRQLSNNSSPGGNNPSSRRARLRPEGWALPGGEVLAKATQQTSSDGAHITTPPLRGDAGGVLANSSVTPQPSQPVAQPAELDLGFIPPAVSLSALAKPPSAPPPAPPAPSHSSPPAPKTISAGKVVKFDE